MELTELTARLVAIDSVNPALVSGGKGEREVAAFVAEWCAGRGLDVEVVGAERPSVIATRRGSGGGRSLLLNGHLDTVGVAGMEAPHEPRVEDGRLYGRGAYDMKGAIAAIMLAAAQATGLRGDVIVTAVADEELASAGTEAVLERVRADAAIVVEPTDLRFAVAHRGFVGFELETAGVAAHGSRPELGVDAIVKMGPVLTALEELDRRLQAGPRHALVGPGLAARVADRRRPGVLELPRALRAHRRAAHDPRRDGGAGRARAARRSPATRRSGSACTANPSSRRPGIRSSSSPPASPARASPPACRSGRTPP